MHTVNQQHRRDGRRNSGESRRGSAIVIALVAVVLLMSLSGAILMETLATNRAGSSSVDRQRAIDAADAGVSAAVANLFADVTEDLGSFDQPVRFSSGGYWTQVEDNGDNTYTLTSVGMVRSEVQAIEVVVVPQEISIFNHALFAGNSDDDPLFTLELGGTGSQADEANGNVYSGNDLEVSGDATATGSVSATGVVTGIGGESHAAAQILPDLEGQDFEHTADFNVMDLFSTGDPEYRYDDTGGYAWQVSEDNPAHIFRVNPSDRSTETSSTEKNDFFLEDPYERVHVDRNQNGKDATHLTIAPDGNNAVYYIDGNLWIHNKKTYSFKFHQPESTGLRVTFVVKGNIYMSDNLFYLNKNKDGIALVAMIDPDVEDSGNIYFGDPAFGTLRHMQAFMYAENNFYDTNLEASGSSSVQVDGTISAGNQVLIERDYGSHHTQLIANSDPRIESGEFELPGIPGLSGGRVTAYPVVSRRRIAVPVP